MPLPGCRSPTHPRIALQEVAHHELVRTLRLDAAKEGSKARQEFEQAARELQVMGGVWGVEGWCGGGKRNGARTMLSRKLPGSRRRCAGATKQLTGGCAVI